MRWPFRRHSDPPRLTPPTPRQAARAPTAVDTAAADVARRPGPPSGPQSLPRSDWAQLAPIGPTLQTLPPLTFHGDRFGRSVAGARTMAASMRHRPGHGDRAPSGLLLDVAQIESVEPAERRTEPDIPPVVPHVPSPPPVHRKVVEHTPRPALMTSDMEVAFPDAPSREPELGSVAISWTAEGGFTETRSPSRMRLVGQRGEFEDVAGLTDDADATESGPSLRYLPVAGPRREQAPRDLVDIVEEATGVRVSDALIDRSPEISDRASSIGAIAFTERGTVHLPAELGDLSEPHNRAIVAHELTHVAQQRTIGRVPAEDSPEGRLLEDEARQVQRRVGGTVRPHFMRRRAGPLDTAAGVQRLANDGDNQYEWQDRGASPSAAREQERSESNLIWGGYESLGDPSRRSAAQQREIDEQDESWARQFEEEHKNQLQAQRNQRYNEMLEEGLRHEREEAVLEEREPKPMTRRELITLRRQLDREMPWQFGPPVGIDPYPDELPPEVEGEENASPETRRTLAPTGAPTPTARGNQPGGRRLTTAPTTAEILGRRAGGGQGPGGRSTPSAPGGATSESGESRYDWQGREPSDQDVVGAVFGGGLLGALFGLA
ncbi:MAG: hypothetical protein K0S92_872, partial [Desertimonas sp.]|nr:hypothetical protein [Desertimonas sp.]